MEKINYSDYQKTGDSDGERRVIVVKDLNNEKLISEIRNNAATDTNSARIKRLLDLPDLSRKEGSPIKFIIDKILDIPSFKDFDVIEIPEIVDVAKNFDLLNTPVDHPSRRTSDSYYADKNFVLRTHTTTMWPFYLKDPDVIEKLNETGCVKCLCHGKVFRKDEVDRKHFPVFHQIDGLYICDKKIKIIGIPELSEVLADIAKNIYGPDVEYQILEDSFPFTDPSIQIEIKKGDSWIEILGAGVVHKKVLSNLGIDPEKYNGWAFGFGVERLAIAKMDIPDIRIFWSNDSRITSQFKDINSKYKEVSKFPATDRDISFIIDKSVNLNNYYEIVRDFAENLIEEVKLLDKYEDKEKFGEDKISYTFRITYRSIERTLANEEINKIQEKIRKKTERELSAKLR